MKSLSVQAIWVYGVLVSLSLKELLAKLSSVITGNSTSDLLLTTSRVAIVLITLLRLYFGAVLFFQSADPSAKEANKNTNATAVDFMAGLVHFLFVAFWASSVETTRQTSAGISYFFIVGIVILNYDWVWILARKAMGIKLDRQIRAWACLNSFTAIVAGLLLTVAMLNSARPEMAEIVAIVPMLLMGALDLVATISGTFSLSSIFSELFSASDPAPSVVEETQNT